MENNCRLINANDPLKQLSDYMEKLHCSTDYIDGLYRGMEIAESYIKNAPTVDAVEVVRCKDCGHYHENICPLWCYTETKPDDFCPYGERKDNVE